MAPVVADRVDWTGASSIGWNIFLLARLLVRIICVTLLQCTVVSDEFSHNGWRQHNDPKHRSWQHKFIGIIIARWISRS